MDNEVHLIGVLDPDDPKALEIKMSMVLLVGDLLHEFDRLSKG